MAIWKLAQGRILDVTTPCLMGILNITPDSFSDGGDNFNDKIALRHAQNMLKEGASIIDVGGESTRPGATPISFLEEKERIIPVIKKLSCLDNCIISVDTYHSQTAMSALEQGAHVINDVFGLQYDPVIAEVAATYHAGIIIMHTNRNRVPLPDVIEDQKYFFSRSLELAYRAGIKEEQIVLDPGFGFGKDFALNLNLFRRIGELKTLGFPLLAATSRKKFLGTITNKATPKERDIATAATSLLLRQAGFSIFRVHDVISNKDALSVFETLAGGISLPN